MAGTFVEVEVMDKVLDSVLEDIDEILTENIPSNPSKYALNAMISLNHCLNNHSYSLLEDINQVIPVLSSSSSDQSGISPASSVTPSPQAPQKETVTSCFQPQAQPTTVYKWPKNGKVEMKDHVFISKDATYRLSQYLLMEKWGRDAVLLYKYIDYIFRCQSFGNQIIEARGNDVHCLIFHTGLQRRGDGEYLWCVLQPNSISKTHKNKQKWRVQFGNVEDSFLTKKSLCQTFKAFGLDLFVGLPQRTVFFRSVSETHYESTWPIKVSWEERLLTNQDRIYKVIGRSAFFDNARKHLKLSELCCAFRSALGRTRMIAAQTPALAVPQGFVDTKRCSYRMELLLPLVVLFNRVHYRFALAIGPSADRAKTYDCKSVLTVAMGYANARLIGPVKSPWLNDLSNTY